MLLFRLALTAIVLLLLSACGGKSSPKPATGKYYSDDGPPDSHTDNVIIADAIPRLEPKSRRGNPQSYTVFGRRYHVLQSSKGYMERGIASWYGKKFHGRKTSSGEIYDMYAMTAAHKTLPIPTYAEVENLQTGKTIVVRINDRGPFREGRIIDLSYAAAQKLGTATKGTGLVEVRAIDPLVWKSDKGQGARLSEPALPPDDIPIYLQLGAFSAKENAESLRRKAAQHAITNVFIAAGHDGSGSTPIYRVRIGPLTTVELADNMIEHLISHGFHDFYVIIE